MEQGKEKKKKKQGTRARTNREAERVWAGNKRGLR